MLDEIQDYTREIIKDVYDDTLKDEQAARSMVYHSIDLSQTYNPETGEFVTSGAAIPAYTGLTVNPSSQGNNIILLGLDTFVIAVDGNPLTGWTVEISDDGATYRTLDLSTAATSITLDGIRINLSAWTHDVVSSNKQFRVSYTGTNIQNPVDNSPLATITNNTTYTNSSTVDLYANFNDWYKLEEAVDTTRKSVLNAADPNYDLDDVNSVGTRAGVDGLALDLTGNNYILTTSGDAFDATVDGKFTILWHMKLDRIPSVVADGQNYPIHKWFNTNSRSWGTLIASTDPNKDVLAALGHNASDETFSQIALNRGVLETDQWYMCAVVFDPLAASPITIYTCKLNDITDFTVDDDNYTAPGAGSPQCQQIGGGTSFVIGKLQAIPTNRGMDGAIDSPMFWDRALTQAEIQAICAAYWEAPFDPAA